MDFKLRCRVVFESPGVTAHKEAALQVANYAVLSLGPDIFHAESEIGEDGICTFDHTFLRYGVPEERAMIPPELGQSYRGQGNLPSVPTSRMLDQGLQFANYPTDTRFPLHGVMRMYAVQWEDRLHPRGGPECITHDAYMTHLREQQHSGVYAGGQGDANSNRMVLRNYFLGSCAIDLKNVLAASHDVTFSPEDAPEATFPCKHNFMPEHSIAVTVLPLVFKDKEEELATQKMLQDTVEAMSEPAVETGTHPKYEMSVLRHLPGANQIVVAQQCLMQKYCGEAVQRKQMVLSDPMMAKFLACATFTQLYGHTVCFTDMGYIQREAAAAVPFSLLMHHMYTAMALHGVTPDEVIAMDGSCPTHEEQLAFIAKGLFNCTAMDSTNGEYVSDYCVAGVEFANPFDASVMRQPMKGMDPPQRLGCRYVYRTMAAGHGEPRQMVRLVLAATEVRTVPHTPNVIMYCNVYLFAILLITIMVLRAGPETSLQRVWSPVRSQQRRL